MDGIVFLFDGCVDGIINSWMIDEIKIIEMLMDEIIEDF